MMANQDAIRTKGRWVELPFERWPSKHKEAWATANRPGSPLRRGGYATSLAPATKLMMMEIYGIFLWWLNTTGDLDPNAGPASQMTTDLRTQFVAARRATVSDNTTYNNLRMLTMMMNCLEPDHDWRWIWRDGGAPQVWEARAARRTPKSFPAGLLVHRLVTEMEKAMGLPLLQVPLDRVRNCLFVGMAVLLGLRPRNQSSMRLERNLICRKDGWEILFEASEVKNGEPILHRIPAVLNPFVDRYLSVDRPRQLDRFPQTTDAVWLSRKGGPLSTQGCTVVFRWIGQEMLGYPLNPNCVRHVQATRILDNDPRDLKTASLALAHTDLSTVSTFYDQSGSRAAQAVWLQVLDELCSDN
jgi:integrase/recombinase XerD